MKEAREQLLVSIEEFTYVRRIITLNNPAEKKNMAAAHFYTWHKVQLPRKFIPCKHSVRCCVVQVQQARKQRGVRVVGNPNVLVAGQHIGRHQGLENSRGGLCYGPWYCCISLNPTQ